MAYKLSLSLIPLYPRRWCPNIPACTAGPLDWASKRAGYRAWRNLLHLTVAGQRRTGSYERHRSSPIVRRASGQMAHPFGNHL